MENQPIANPSDISSSNLTSVGQPTLPPQTKTNLMMPILVTFLVSGVVFGFGGYFLGKQSSNPQNISTESTQPTTTEMNDSKPSNAVNVDKNTYVDQKNKFSFSYPSNLKPFELANGVVSFLPQDVYDACKSAQGSKDIQAFEPCSKAQFNLNGFEVSPTESYSKYSSDNENIAILSTYTDSQDRTWNTGLVLGQVYNFDAFGTVDSRPVKISFQYGFNAPSEKEVVSFFNEILATLKFTN